LVAGGLSVSSMAGSGAASGFAFARDRKVAIVSAAPIASK